MKQFIADRHTTPATPVMDPIGEPAIPLYPTEQDLLDDLANLEVGQIAGTIDPAESELIGVLIQRIQALESKLESDDVYSTEEVKTNKKILIDGVWKDIYRKCHTVQISSTGWTTLFNLQDIGINMDTMVSVSGYCVTAGGGLTRPILANDQGDTSQFSFYIQNKNAFKVSMQNNDWAGSYTLIFEYTKPSA